MGTVLMAKGEEQKMFMKTEFERPDANDIRQAALFSSATLHEASGKKGALPSEIKPLSADMTVCGTVITVSSPPGDNIMLHHAITVARPGDILVVDVSGAHKAGYWGDILTHAALYSKLGGLVIDGCVRDGNEIIRLGFPVFSRGLCIRGTTKKGGGLINYPIQLGEVRIMPGDLVVGDADGVVVIPRKEIRQTIERASAREEEEARIREELKKGKTTLELYGWDVQHREL